MLPRFSINKGMREYAAFNAPDGSGNACACASPRGLLAWFANWTSSRYPFVVTVDGAGGGAGGGDADQYSTGRGGVAREDGCTRQARVAADAAGVGYFCDGDCDTDRGGFWLRGAGADSAGC